MVFSSAIDIGTGFRTPEVTTSLAHSTACERERFATAVFGFDWRLDLNNMLISFCCMKNCGGLLSTARRIQQLDSQSCDVAWSRCATMAQAAQTVQALSCGTKLGAVTKSRERHTRDIRIS